MPKASEPSPSFQETAREETTRPVVFHEDSPDPANTQIGDNPKHKMLMAWKSEDELGTHTFHYHHGAMGFGTARHNYSMHDAEGNFVGTMGLDHTGEIQHIEIHPDLRRQGLATKLYNFGHEIHEEIPTIPAPKHSDSRTASGDAWARAVGGELPPRESEVEDHDYRSARWPNLRDPSVSKLKEHLNRFHAEMMENGMDSESVGAAKYHVDSAHEYLDRANEMGKGHRNYSDTMNKAHQHIDELTDIHQEWYGDMDKADALHDHIGRLY